MAERVAEIGARRFAVTAGAGTLRAAEGVTLPHAWTDEGVSVVTDFTGAHLLHLAVAACVLNDLYREAAEAGVLLHGVEVRADGDFDADTWSSNGIGYAVRLDTSAGDDEVAALLARVDEVAEIPRTVRAGASVRRVKD
ncbi:OsmC family protein [Nocardioides sp.]|uniref:OsmC family protein n=1 Tax=Nocardioides sp. TaxID=35761 RepID=UPI0035284E2A